MTWQNHSRSLTVCQALFQGLCLHWPTKAPGAALGGYVFPISQIQKQRNKSHGEQVTEPEFSPPWCCPCCPRSRCLEEQQPGSAPRPAHLGGQGNLVSIVHLDASCDAHVT